MTTFENTITATAGGHRGGEIVLLDAGVEERDALATAPPGTRVVMLEAETPLPAIARALAGCAGLSAIHVVAHGSPGALHFAGGRVDAEVLAADRDALGRIAAALAGHGDIILHACETGAGAAGRAFVDALAAATGANVAAASRPVGAADRGGTWTLDVAAGAVAAHAFPDAAARSAFTGLLSPPVTLPDWNDVTPGLIGFDVSDFSHTLSNGWTATVDVVASPNGNVALEVSDDDGANGVGGNFPDTETNGDNHLAAYALANNIAGLRLDFDTASGLGGFYVNFRQEGASGVVTVRRTLLLEGGGSINGNLNLEIADDGEFHWHFIDTAVLSAGFGPFRGILFSRPDGLGFSSIAIDDLQPPPSPPTVTAPGTTPTFTENGSAVLVDSGLTVDDPEDDAITGATVTITGNFQAETDVLAVTDGNGITSSYDATTGVLTLNGTATEADYQAVLRTLTFASTSENPTADQRTLTIEVSDASGTGSATQTVDVTPVDDPTTITAPGAAVDYTENDGWVLVDEGVTIADPEGDDIFVSSVTVTIQDGEVGSDELWPFYNAIDRAFDPDTLTLTLTGALATVSDYEADLQSVHFRSTSEDPSEDTRTILYTVHLHGGGEITATQTINVTAVNDLPSVTLPDTTLEYEEDGEPAAVGASITITDLDDDIAGAAVSIMAGRDPADTDALAVTDGSGITSSFDAETGVLTLTGTASPAAYESVLETLTFSTASESPSEDQRTVAIVVTDASGDTGQDMRTIDVTAVNDAPVVTAPGTAATFTESGDPVLVDAGLTLDDPEDDTITSATVAIGQGYQPGDVLEVTTAHGITAEFNADTQFLVLGGFATEAQYQEVLRTLTFSSTAGEALVGGDRTLIYRVLGSNNITPGQATQTVSVTADNDDPTLTGLPETVTVPEGGGPVDLSAVEFADPDSGNEDVDLTFSVNRGSWSFGLASGVALNTDSSQEWIRLTGTAAAIDAWLDDPTSLIYTPASTDANGDGYATVTVTANDGGNTGDGGGADVSLGTFDIDVTAVNDAPAFAGGGGTVEVVANADPVVLDGDVTIADTELDALANGDGDHSGASLTVSRHGGADADDVFSVVPGEAINVSGNEILAGGNAIATVDLATPGTITITFADNGTTPTSDLVNTVLQSVAYRYTGDTDDAGAALDWVYDDGNAGAQGSGGAQTALASTGLELIVPIAVTTAEDVVDAADGVTSLREAVALANDTGGRDIIVFAEETAGTVALDSSLAITDYLTIDGDVDGDGRADVALDGGGATRHFDIEGTYLSVELRDLVLVNGAADDGGSIRASGLIALSIDGLTFVGNVASGSGGALAIGPNANVTATDVLFSGNQARSALGGSGGAIRVDGGTLTLRNATITDNEAYYGAGIGIRDAVVDISSTTITGNSGFAYVGFFNEGVDGGVADQMTLSNSIVAGNDGTHDYGFTISWPGTLAGSNNILSFARPEWADTAILADDPMLSPLADNGGPVATMLPNPFSPAFNAGDDAAVPQGIATAANGVARILFGATDIGAAEYADARPVVDLDPSADGLDLAATTAEGTPAPLASSDTAVADPDGDPITAVTIAVSSPDGAAAGLGVSGAAIDALTGGSGAADIVLAKEIALTGLTANVDAVATFLSAVTFTNTADAPSASGHTVTVTLTDSDGEGRPSTATFTVSGVNDAPGVTGLFGKTGTVNAGATGVPLAIAADAVVSDPDSADFAGGTLTLSGDGWDGSWHVGSAAPAANTTVVVSGTTIGTVSGTEDGQSGRDLVIDLDGDATPARVTEFLRALALDAPSSPGTHTFTLSLNDGDGANATVGGTFTVEATPDEWSDTDDDPLSDEDLFTGPDDTVIDDSVDLGLEPMGEFETIIVGGASANRGTTRDERTGETVEVTAVNPRSEGRTEGAVGGVGVSIPSGVGFVSVRRQNTDPAGLSHVLDPIRSERTADLAPFMTAMSASGPTNLLQFVPVNPGGGSQPLSFTIDDPNGGVVVVDLSAMTGNGPRTVEVVGTSPVVVIGDADVTGDTHETIHHLFQGGSGAQTVMLGAGDDTLSGGSGDDTIGSAEGQDLIRGGAGDDHLTGGADADILAGQVGEDTARGSAGPDTLYGGEGDDHLSGEAGNDALFGGSGGDTVDGGAGNDVLEPGEGDDHAVGGDGRDRFHGAAGDDTLAGQVGDDVVRGGADDDRLFGGAGADLLNGQRGADHVVGGDGDDTLAGGAGADTLAGHDGDDVLFASPGDDVLFGHAGADSLAGQSGHDRADGGTGDDSLTGGAGNDTLVGREGDDVIHGGPGDDHLVSGPGDDHLSGGAGADRFVVGPPIGEVRISDFEPGIDSLMLPNVEAAAIAVHAVANGVRIDVDATGTILLTGVSPSVSADDLFA